MLHCSRKMGRATRLGIARRDPLGRSLDCRCRAFGCEQDGIHAKMKVFLVAGPRIERKKRTSGNQIIKEPPNAENNM